jgi:hypothetical protein
MVTLTDVSDKDDIAFILADAVEAARRWNAKLHEIHLPLAFFTAAAGCPGISLCDSGDLGVVRLQYEPANVASGRRPAAEARLPVA